MAPCGSSSPSDTSTMSPSHSGSVARRDPGGSTKLPASEGTIDSEASSFDPSSEGSSRAPSERASRPSQVTADDTANPVDHHSTGKPGGRARATEPPWGSAEA